jgi:hypothetical protein
MNWPVNIVTAFGRGETLALALQENGFEVHVLDFTNALGSEWNQGPGPFPIAAQVHLPAQKQLLEEVKPLDRGITFWLKSGPLELGGKFATFFENHAPAVEHLKKDIRSNDFESDWLRRFMKIWTSPYHVDSWAKTGASTFPYADRVGLIPLSKESFVISYDRYQTLGYKFSNCRHMNDVLIEKGRIIDLEVDTGRAVGVAAPQWIWCLSSEESAKVGADVSNRLFNNAIRKPEWRWLSFQGACERGSWSNGFPDYVVVIDDIHLPWNYTNVILLRWTETDVFKAWIKVPDTSFMEASKRLEWAQDIEGKLSARLSLANWRVDAVNWSACPHSPVFSGQARDESPPSWKNWDWIAPETTSRLDLSSRLELEAAAYHRLVSWRNEQIKKQGALHDHAVHAP